MAIIKKVNKNISITNNDISSLLSTIYHQKTIDDLKTYNIISKENEFILFLNEEIYRIKKMDAENVLTIIFDISKSLKNKVKEIVKTLATKDEKVIFMKFAETKISRELLSLYNFCVESISQKRDIELNRYCEYLISNSATNYRNFQIHEENIRYYTTYISIVNKQAEDAEKIAKHAIYKAVITAALESADYIYAKSILDIKDINKLFSTYELKAFYHLINKAHDDLLIKQLEQEFILSKRSVAENIEEINSAVRTGVIDISVATKLIDKIENSSNLKNYLFQKEYHKSTFKALYQLLDKTYRSEITDIDYDTIALDENSKTFIKNIINNSSKPITDKEFLKSDSLFNKISERIASGLIRNTQQIIEIKDTLKYLRIEDTIKLLKLLDIAERDRLIVETDV